MTTRRCRYLLWISDREWSARKITRSSSMSTGLLLTNYRISRLPCRLKSEPQLIQSTRSQRNLRQSCTKICTPPARPTHMRIIIKACNKATHRPIFWAGPCALQTCLDNRVSYNRSEWVTVWFTTSWLGLPLPCTTANPLCKTKSQSRKQLSSPITQTCDRECHSSPV